MKHLPLMLAAFLILIAGFVSSLIVADISGDLAYGATSQTYYRVPNPRSTSLGPGEIPLTKFDFNKDGVIDKDDVRDHQNVLRRCIRNLWSSHCTSDLDIDGNGRYEYIDNRYIYQVVLSPVWEGQSEEESFTQRTNECEDGRIRCIGDRRYNLCGNFDGDPYLEWGPNQFVQEKGKWCRYGKIVTRHFNPDY